MPAIEFNRVSKIYQKHFWEKKFLALNAVSFAVPEGSIFGFLGANGAGKTTAIKLMMGLQKPTNGSITFFGADPSEQKHRVGFMPERPYFHDNLTAREFLDFHRSLFGDQKKKTGANNKELLHFVGLENVEGKLLRDFSKGMLQRIGLAQALVNDPDLVVLDEPMSGLDPVGRRDIRNLIVALAERGKTIFFSTHILSDVEAICHRIAFLEKGLLKLEGAVREILQPEVQKQEILFSGIHPQTIPALAQALPVGAGWKIETNNEAHTKELAKLIWQAAGSIDSIQAAHRNLEDVLFQVGGGK